MTLRLILVFFLIPDRWSPRRCREAIKYQVPHLLLWHPWNVRNRPLIIFISFLVWQALVVPAKVNQHVIFHVDTLNLLYYGQVQLDFKLEAAAFKNHLSCFVCLRLFHLTVTYCIILDFLLLLSFKQCISWPKRYLSVPAQQREIRQAQQKERLQRRIVGDWEQPKSWAHCTQGKSSSSRSPQQRCLSVFILQRLTSDATPPWDLSLF